jgi:hypothetical protein
VRKIIAALITSLDGLIEGPNGKTPLGGMSRAFAR